jgi:hypothetical protein
LKKAAILFAIIVCRDKCVERNSSTGSSLGYLTHDLLSPSLAVFEFGGFRIAGMMISGTTVEIVTSVAN